ncbi:hypothetical protein [Streptomyces sp. NBC_01443]|uniref:hypothetical protein n=1 Tax=Streptomyces sp. NBC_01443 TaxID=2903868 RepID=UPI002B1CDDDA|nr:hypothetical protein [Streptomyces sp. NBC_01443]
MTSFGYFLSSEEFTPRRLLDQARPAEDTGFTRLPPGSHRISPIGGFTMRDIKFPAAPGPSFLTVYLNDHLTGSGAGVRLARRLAKRHRRTDGGPELAKLAEQIDEDRQSLRRVMRDLDVPVRRAREVVGRIGESAGRLKPNGSLVRRSPLSDVVELEMMLLGVEGKAACWRALRELTAADDRLDAPDLDRLLARADTQVRTLDDLRRRRAAEVFAAELGVTAAVRASGGPLRPAAGHR